MDKKWPDGGFIDSVKEGRLEIKPGARVKTHAISSKDVGRIRENEFLYACGVDWSYHSEPTIERCIVFDKDLVGYVIKVTNRTAWYIHIDDLDTPYHKEQRKRLAETIEYEKEIKRKIESGELDPNNLRDSLYIPRFFLLDRIRDRVDKCEITGSGKVPSKDSSGWMPEGLKTDYEIGELVVHTSNNITKWVYVPTEFNEFGEPDLTKVSGPAKIGIVGKIVDCWNGEEWEIGGDPDNKGYSKLPPLVNSSKDDPTYEVEFLYKDLYNDEKESGLHDRRWHYSWKELRPATKTESNGYIMNRE